MQVTSFLVSLKKDLFDASWFVGGIPQTCVIFITYQGYYQLITFNGNLDHLAGLLYLSGSYEPFPAFWREVTMFRLKLGSEELCSTSLMVE
jgi:hypothetical protein